jgi:hypothetical protein
MLFVAANEQLCQFVTVAFAADEPHRQPQNSACWLKGENLLGESLGAACW